MWDVRLVLALAILGQCEAIGRRHVPLHSHLLQANGGVGAGAVDGPSLMNRTRMKLEDLPESAQYKNGRTVTADWYNEYPDARPLGVEGEEDLGAAAPTPQPEVPAPPLAPAASPGWLAWLRRQDMKTWAPLGVVSFSLCCSALFLSILGIIAFAMRAK